jgi:HEAT repeat protein
MQISQGAYSGDMSSKLPEDDIKAVKKIIESLLLAMKMSSLYPEGHTIYDKAIIQVQGNLDAFFQIQRGLRLYVEKDRLLFGEEVVLAGPAEEGNLAYTLFRDGIQWLEFQAGIDSSEIKQFLGTLNRYKNLLEESDGDIATALWEAQFPHLQYSAEDILWEDSMQVDTLLSEGKGDGQLKSIFKEKPATSGGTVDDAMVGTPLELTSEKEVNLNELILDDEEGNATKDVLNMLMYILQNTQDGDFLASGIEYLEEEFQEAIVRNDYDFALKILQMLHRVCQVFNKEKPWALPLVEKFFLSKSGSNLLQTLQEMWSHLDPKQLEEVKEILVLLKPEAVQSLVPMLLHISSTPLEQMLANVITSLAARDLGPLEYMLHHSDEHLLQKLIQVLGHLEGERSTQILFGKLKHPSERIREEVVRALLIQEPWFPDKLFPLIEDESEYVRSVTLKYLERYRNEEVENLLLDYLDRKKIGLSDEKHILACFRTLGRCGTTWSIPFLRKVLFHRAWISTPRGETRRLGAAIALYELGTDEAQQILEEAAESPRPAVRQAALNSVSEVD